MKVSVFCVFYAVTKLVLAWFWELVKLACLSCLTLSSSRCILRFRVLLGAPTCAASGFALPIHPPSFPEWSRGGSERLSLTHPPGTHGRLHGGLGPGPPLVCAGRGVLKPRQCVPIRRVLRLLEPARPRKKFCGTQNTGNGVTCILSVCSP